MRQWRTRPERPATRGRNFVPCSSFEIDHSLRFVLGLQLRGLGGIGLSFLCCCCIGLGRCIGLGFPREPSLPSTTTREGICRGNCLIRTETKKRPRCDSGTPCFNALSSLILNTVRVTRLGWLLNGVDTPKGGELIGKPYQ